MSREQRDAYRWCKLEFKMRRKHSDAYLVISGGMSSESVLLVNICILGQKISNDVILHSA